MKRKLVGEYELEYKLGQGQYGEVWLCKKEGQLFAVKVISKKRIDKFAGEYLEREIDILKKVNHENIVRFVDVLQTQRYYYVFLEYCNKGDLMQIWIQRSFSKEEIESFCFQIIEGFLYLYSNKIIHRDFKLANALLSNKTIKISDFGFSWFLGWNEKTRSYLGTPITMAPEILQGKDYDNKVDIWAVGVCFYMMIYNQPPFKGDSCQDLRSFTNFDQVKFEDCQVNQNLIQLIKKMLLVDPKKRIDWNQVRLDQFYQSMQKKTFQLASIWQEISFSQEVKLEPKQRFVNFLSESSIVEKYLPCIKDFKEKLLFNHDLFYKSLITKSFTNYALTVTEKVLMYSLQLVQTLLVIKTIKNNELVILLLNLVQEIQKSKIVFLGYKRIQLKNKENIDINKEKKNLAKFEGQKIMIKKSFQQELILEDIHDIEEIWIKVKPLIKKLTLQIKEENIEMNDFQLRFI